MSIVSWCSDKGKSNFTSNDDRYGLLINQIASKESSAGGNNYQLIVSCSLQRYKSNDCSHFIIFTEKLLGNKRITDVMVTIFAFSLCDNAKAQNSKLSVAFIYKRIFILYNTCRGLIQLKKRPCGRKK